MKEESIVPQTLLGTYNRFSSLKTEKEEKEFWEELAKNNEGLSPEIFSQQLKQELDLFSDRGKILEQKIKKIPAKT